MTEGLKKDDSIYDVNFTVRCPVTLSEKSRIPGPIVNDYLISFLSSDCVFVIKVRESLNIPY